MDQPLTRKQERQTRLNELVETHNLVLSLRRLRSAPYDNERWKRALYHALLLADVPSNACGEIRKILELP